MRECHLDLRTVSQTSVHCYRHSGSDIEQNFPTGNPQIDIMDPKDHRAETQGPHCLNPLARLQATAWSSTAENHMSIYIILYIYIYIQRERDIYIYINTALNPPKLAWQNMPPALLDLIHKSPDFSPAQTHRGHLARHRHTRDADAQLSEPQQQYPEK